MIKHVLYLLFLFPVICIGQNYTSYFTGNPFDTITNPQGGICLMGGATEDDNAMKWFLHRADGGDILVLRTSGSNGYNDYLYYSLGIPVNSVETIVFNNASASNDSYVHQKIKQAEAIWFAGGNQWTYISYWRNTPVDSLVNLAIHQRNIVVGGTSAGMAIQGKFYFSAQNGTVTSDVALADPYNIRVTVDSMPFLDNNYLNNVITDTHFDNPDRRGRMVAFLARIYTDYGIFGKGIACDEYTAVCIDSNGIAMVYGEYPPHNDNAYFIQNNCELTIQAPENCTPENPLTWNLGGEAIKVFKVKGTSDGSNTFDLNNWQTGTGGSWFDWSVNEGTFNEQIGDEINCGSFVDNYSLPDDISIYPNPSSDRIFISTGEMDIRDSRYVLHNTLGQKIPVKVYYHSDNLAEVHIDRCGRGVYFLQIFVNGLMTINYPLVKK